jgi:hydroxymethylpyrimidine/phosphomethylpyrimidine kinase
VTPPVALTIAGSDSGGGAGIQADLKTFATHGVFGTSVVTALTAQNTATVRAIEPVSPGFVAAQLEAVLDDLPVAAVKTGMLAVPATVAVIAEFAGRLPNLVVDPVLVSSTGAELFGSDARRAYVDLLFPLATVVTPNAREAAVLTGRPVTCVDDAIAAAEELGRAGPKWVVVKGAHLNAAADGSGDADAADGSGDAADGSGDAGGGARAAGSTLVDSVPSRRPKSDQIDQRRSSTDVVWHDGHVELLRAPWIETPNNHGTGCTFAAATAARLARGDDVRTALDGAKSYVHRALAGAAGWRLGAGHGPLSWEVDT